MQQVHMDLETYVEALVQRIIELEQRVGRIENPTITAQYGPDVYVSPEEQAVIDLYKDTPNFYKARLLIMDNFYIPKGFTPIQTKDVWNNIRQSLKEHTVNIYNLVVLLNQYMAAWAQQGLKYTNKDGVVRPYIKEHDFIYV